MGRESQPPSGRQKSLCPGRATLRGPDGPRSSWVLPPGRSSRPLFGGRSGGKLDRLPEIRTGVEDVQKTGREFGAHDRTTLLLRPFNKIEHVLDKRSAGSQPKGGYLDQKARRELWQCAGLGGYGQGDGGGGADPLRGVQGGHSRAR